MANLLLMIQVVKHDLQGRFLRIDRWGLILQGVVIAFVRHPAVCFNILDGIDEI